MARQLLTMKHIREDAEMRVQMGATPSTDSVKAIAAFWSDRRDKTKAKRDLRYSKKALAIHVSDRGTAVAKEGRQIVMIFYFPESAWASRAHQPFMGVLQQRCGRANSGQLQEQAPHDKQTRWRSSPSSKPQHVCPYYPAWISAKL